MIKDIWAAAFSLMLAGCSNREINITPEYIINEHWGQQANAIEVSRQKVKKDSMINPFLDLKQGDILENLEVDSSFVYQANVKIDHHRSYKNQKIYFNRYNGFYWRKGFFGKNGDTVKVIGDLQKDNWYKFSYLVTHPYYVYVYVDSSGIIHRFDVNVSNY